jgi:hypothetical protein
LKFESTNAPGVDKAKLGKGTFWEGNELKYLLTNADVRHERYLAEENLKCIRREIAGGEYYFITNDGKETFNNWVLLNTPIQYAALYDPMLERSGVAMTRLGDANTLDIFLQLAPGESCVVQTGPAKFRGGMFPYAKAAGDAVTISGEWKLNFISGGPTLPKETTVGPLQSWTDLQVEGVKEFLRHCAIQHQL